MKKTWVGAGGGSAGAGGKKRKETQNFPEMNENRAEENFGGRCTKVAVTSYYGHDRDVCQSSPQTANSGDVTDRCQSLDCGDVTRIVTDECFGPAPRRMPCGWSVHPVLLLLLLGALDVEAEQEIPPCPARCACYVPSEVHCTFRSLTSFPAGISRSVERVNLG